MLKAQEEVQVEDEHIEGVQVFSQLQVEKERKEKERIAKLKAAQPNVMQEPARDEVQTQIHSHVGLKHVWRLLHGEDYSICI